MRKMAARASSVPSRKHWMREGSTRTFQRISHGSSNTRSGNIARKADWTSATAIEFSTIDAVPTLGARFTMTVIEPFYDERRQVMNRDRLSQLICGDLCLNSWPYIHLF